VRVYILFEFMLSKEVEYQLTGVDTLRRFKMRQRQKSFSAGPRMSPIIGYPKNLFVTIAILPSFHLGTRLESGNFRAGIAAILMLPGQHSPRH